MRASDDRNRQAPEHQGARLGTGWRACDSFGAVKVDALSKSNIESIYAVGDVTNRVALTPVPSAKAMLLPTRFWRKPEAVVHTDIPTAVFSTPELALSA